MTVLRGVSMVIQLTSDGHSIDIRLSFDGNSLNYNTLNSVINYNILSPVKCSQIHNYKLIGEEIDTRRT
jgi:hypothetical protein